MKSLFSRTESLLFKLLIIMFGGMAGLAVAAFLWGQFFSILLNATQFFLLKSTFLIFPTIGLVLGVMASKKYLDY
jgi:hypothetical protein